MHSKYIKALYGSEAIKPVKKEIIVSIKQDETAPVTVEVLAESIKSISEGIKKLRGGSLNDEALIMLIVNAAPTVRKLGRHSRQRIRAKEVRAVLDGLAALEKTYIRKQPK